MINKPYLGFFGGELRTVKGDDGGITIVGLAAPYGKWSQLIFNSFKEQFRSNAFKEHLETNPDIICTIQHDPNKITGRTSARTLTVKNTDDGVYIENKIPNTTYATDLITSIERGDIRGMSFIFDVNRDDEQWNKVDGYAERTINKAKMLEVTYTPIPAYESTTLNLRSMGFANEEQIKEMIATIPAKANALLDAKKTLAAMYKQSM